MLVKSHRFSADMTQLTTGEPYSLALSHVMYRRDRILLTKFDSEESA